MNFEGLGLWGWELGSLGLNLRSCHGITVFDVTILKWERLGARVRKGRDGNRKGKGREGKKGKEGEVIGALV